MKIDCSRIPTAGSVSTRLSLSKLYLLFGFLVITIGAYIFWLLLTPSASLPYSDNAAAHFERKLYVLFILVLLPISWITTQASCLFSYKRLDSRQRSLLMGLLVCLWLVFFGAMIPSLITMLGFVKPSISWALYVCMFCSVIVSVLALKCDIFYSTKSHPMMMNSILFAILIAGSALIASHAIAGISQVDTSWKWAIHFDAVAYTISQVAAGRTLLHDLPAQYGLYAEFIGPLVRGAGLSVSGITGLFAVMSVVAYLSLAFVFFKLTSSLLLRMFWAVSSVLLSHFIWTGHSVALHFDPYYQYFPLRTFFPSISLLFFWIYISRKQTILSTVGFSIFLTVGIVWNLDSGIPALGSFATYLILSVLFAERGRRSEGVVLLAAVGASVVTVLFLFYVYLTWKGGAPTPWMEWFRYQRIFYIEGAYAIRLPYMPHPWMLTLIVYVAGILGYMRAASNCDPSRFWRVILYASVMGLGLFAYYQHRAHDQVFLAVVWPAVFIGLLLSDKVAKHILINRMPRLLLLTLFPVFIFGTVNVGYFVFRLPPMFAISKENLSSIDYKIQTKFSNNVEFIRARINSNNWQQIAILAPGQSMYFLELKIASALTGPGITESFLATDTQALADQLGAKKPEKLFVGKIEGKIPSVYLKALEKYSLIDENENGIMYYHAKNG